MNTLKLRDSAISVVVTGVGAIIGQGIVSSLRISGAPVRIIGIDRNPRGLGPFWCDIFFDKPKCAEDTPEYLAFWKGLLTAEKVDLVIPGLDIDVQYLNQNRSLVDGTSTHLALNSAHLIDIAQDKWEFHNELLRQGYPVIPSRLAGTWDECVGELGAPPFILKPRRGNGSRGIRVLENPADLEYWSQKAGDDFFIQKLVGDNDSEYTVGTFGLGDGSALKPIIFRRHLSVAGNTSFAEVVADPLLAEEVKCLVEIFRPLGPTNFQFRVEGGKAHLLEINPRFSSSNSLRTAFGYNEAVMTLDFYLRGKRPTDPEIVPGRGWRYYADHVVT